VAPQVMVVLRTLRVTLVALDSDPEFVRFVCAEAGIEFRQDDPQTTVLGDMAIMIRLWVDDHRRYVIRPVVEGEKDYVVCSTTGRPLDRYRISEKGVAGEAMRKGLGRVTAQTLRRSVATATAHARVPVVVAAASTGHSHEVTTATTQGRSTMPRSGRWCVRLASIGFGF
jgi:integrase